MPPFHPIPKNVGDVRLCQVNRWGAGTDLSATMGRLGQFGVARDGLEGCFVFHGEIDQFGNEAALRLQHVDSSGTTVTSGDIFTNWGSPNHEVWIVESAPGSCIVITSDGTGFGAHLEARRFDTNCAPLWSNPVRLSSTTQGFDCVAAASDGQNGAVVCFVENAGASIGKVFRLQRIDANGNLPWGPGASIAGPSNTLFAGITPQIVSGQNEFAVLWLEITTPFNVRAAWIDTSGTLLQSPFVVGTTLETWEGSAKRSAVADFSGGGFYVSLCDASSLKLMRFDARSTAATWTQTAQAPIIHQAFSLAEDGNGGALLATIETSGLISVARFDRSGTNQWAFASAANAGFIDFGLPLGNFLMPDWGGVVAIAPRSSGGAILVNPDWSIGSQPRLYSRCFNDLGEPDGGVVYLNVTQLGVQEFPRLTDHLDSTPVGGPIPLPRGSDPGSVICVWKGPSNSSLTAQKVGCCGAKHGPILQVPGSVPPNWPRNYAGHIVVSFPAVSEKERYGIVPLSQLAETPQVNIPGCLLTPGVDAPGWVRILLGNVPEDVNVDLWAHNGELAGVAERLRSHAKRAGDEMMTLSFSPDPKLSYLLCFRRPEHSKGKSAIPIRIHFESGRGSAPPEAGRSSDRGKS